MDTSHLVFWQWVLLAVAGFMVGLSKTGIAGLGVLAAAVFANVLPARASTGALLPLLILADVFAVASYFRQAIWSHLFKLFPWAVAGIIIGALAMGRMDDKQVRVVIGLILVAMVSMQIWRKLRTEARRKAGEEVEDKVPEALWFAALMGILAGFTTMLANAAGPIMTLYLLAMRMPKMRFMGTAAWYFFILNSFKVPFNCHLGQIDGASMILDMKLAPFAIVGALYGRSILPHINQKVFESLALGLALVAGVKLLF